MPRIKAICLSDLHFGYWGSVLTEPTEPDPAEHPTADIDKISPVLVRLVECIDAVLGMHEGKDPPRLVLAGDVLELSLAYTNEAASVFAQFLQQLFRERNLPLDRSIVYLPGNHDHHLWELAREQQYTNYLSEADTDVPFKNTPWHATHLFPWREDLDVPNRNVGNLVLDVIAGKALNLAEQNRVSFLSMYPNFGLLGDEGRRCTVFHHGHFTESIYYLMTELRSVVFPDRPRPQEIWDIEVENFAWIDFLWGTLGRSGGVGDDVEQIYEELRTKAGRDRLVDRLAPSIERRLELSWWNRAVVNYAVKRLLTVAVKRLAAMEREGGDGLLSEKSRKLLEEYIDHYVEGQFKRERKEDRGEQMPKHVNFVFGHTHRPFEEVLDAAKFKRPVHVYNTGGWVVDSAKADTEKGGAIVVVDEDGNAASIHMYKESEDSKDYAVKVKQAGDDNPLSKQLRSLVQPEKAPWSDFSREVANAVRRRQDILKSVTG